MIGIIYSVIGVITFIGSLIYFHEQVIFEEDFMEYMPIVVVSLLAGIFWFISIPLVILTLLVKFFFMLAFFVRSLF